MNERLARKVLLVGWDAADWKMIQPMLAQGQLPTLASLLERGTWGNLATVRPILSPMLWTSIATGKRADKHGILGFLEPEPDGTGVRPVASTSRTCKALWNIASQSGLRSSVVNWFATHPAEPIAGTVVSDRYAALATPGVATRAVTEGMAHPAELAPTLEQLIVDPADLDAQALLPFIPRAAEIDQDRDDRLARLAVLLARTSTVHAAACHVLPRDDWDLACVYYGGIDEFGHSFMPYHPPRLPGISERDAELYGQVMTGCYRFHDMMLGTLLNIAGPETTVVLVSDHGFHHGDHRPGADGYIDPESWHRPFGIACMAGPGIQQGQRLYGGTLLDVTPTILNLLGLPVGADMDGRAWLEVLTPSRTPSPVLSWDRKPADHDPATPAQAPTAADRLAEIEAMRHLAELGYVEEADDDAREQVERTLTDQRCNLARALTDSRRAHKAVPLWEQLADEHPDEPAYRYELARCLHRLGRDDEALAQLDRIDSAHRSSPEYVLLEGRILLKHRRLDEAAAALGALAERLPDAAIVHTRLGQVYLHQGNLTQAERALATAWQLDEQNPVTADALSELALARRDHAAAMRHALDAVSLAHHFPRAHYHLGCALAGEGQTEQAIQAFQTCLALAPGHRAAHARLAELAPNDAAGGHALAARSPGSREAQGFFAD